MTDVLREAITRFTNWCRVHGETARAAVLGAALLGAILLSVIPLRDQVENRATAWLDGLRPAAEAEAQVPVIEGLRAASPENSRLLRQLELTRRRVTFHGKVAVFFYARYYLALVLASVTGLVAAAMLVLITRVGWQSASAYIKVTFFISAAAGAYYASFPGMFRQSANVERNVSLYVAYVNVENEVLSYLATGEDSSGTQQPPKAFVHALDRRLAELNSVPIGFDAAKLPSSVDAFKGISQ